VEKESGGKVMEKSFKRKVIKKAFLFLI